MPAELRELLERVGGFGEGIQTTLMDLGEGGDVEHLPIGADETGDLFLLLHDGTVWHGGERVAPTLGWFIARLGVEAWGRRQGEDGRTRRHLRELLKREV